MAVDAEVIRYGIKTLLESESFAEVLRKIYAEHDDEEIPFPREVFPSGRAVPNPLPCVEIVLNRARRHNPEGLGIDSTLDFDIYYHVVGADEERLQQEIERYTRAVEDYFIDSPHMHPFVLNCAAWTGDVDYSPPARLGDDNAPLLKSGLVNLSVRTMR